MLSMRTSPPRSMVFVPNDPKLQVRWGRPTHLSSLQIIPIPQPGNRPLQTRKVPNRQSLVLGASHSQYSGIASPGRMEH